MDDDFNNGIVKYQNGLGVDDKLKFTVNGQAKYFLQDHLGSTIGLTDASGNVLEQTNYDSFGKVTNNLTTRYQFTGREKDDFTGLHYYRARWYDSKLGRFISEDPIGFDGKDVNWFVYVKNNPINRIDPEGLESFGEIQMYLPDGIVPNRAEKEAKYLKCYQNNKFSSLFNGSPNFQSAVEFTETPALASLSLDGLAATRKFFGKSTASGNQYASGINMVSKDLNRAMGFPRIAGSPLGKYLTPIGTKLTPPLAIIGGFTLGYNETISVQCVCGILE